MVAGVTVTVRAATESCRCVAVCLVWFCSVYSVLQCTSQVCTDCEVCGCGCVAACCRALQCVALRCSLLQCVADVCSVLQSVAVFCNLMQFVAV